MQICPRVTNQEHLTRRRYLRLVWTERQSCFSYLRAETQWHLHDYFKPALELTDQQVLQHWQEVSKARPTLPQQAGRAFSQLDAAMTAGEPGSRTITTPRPKALSRRAVHSISVGAVVKPQIDVEKFVRVLREVARAKLSDRTRPGASGNASIDERSADDGSAVAEAVADRGQ